MREELLSILKNNSATLQGTNNKTAFIDLKLDVWRIRYVRAIRQFRDKQNALIAYLDDTRLNENYRKRKS